MIKLLFVFIFLLPLSSRGAIEDNSFLIEEAFNQNSGEYQFIQNYQTYTDGYLEYFLQIEAPITHLTHQISFDISRANSAISDLAINYRYQAYNQDDKILTERISLIVPTGSERYGTGQGTYGVSVMQSATISFSEKLVNHWNIGGSLFPGEETLTEFVGGTSFVYLYKDDLNFLIETVFETGQAEALDGEIENETSFFLNPGLRFAYDYDWNDSQLVPGISLPLQYTEQKLYSGLFLYLSFEASLH